MISTDLHIAPPSGWTDRSMIIRSAPAAAGRAVAPNVVIAKETIAKDEDFWAFCARQADLLESTLPDYVLADERRGRLGDLPAKRLEFSWTSGAGTLRQQISFIDAGGGETVIFTASAAAQDFDDHRAIFDAQLAALKISSEPGAQAGAAKSGE